MAFFTTSFRSDSLNHDTSINVIIPESCEPDDIPTLYLLHGMHGNHESWCRKSCIERYAHTHKVAVVCPDGENSFYADMANGKKFYKYVSEELVDFTRRVFRFSDKREKTFIAGLSMGGYGAFKLALSKPEQYAAAASLSGCVNITELLANCPWETEAKAIWGENYYENVKNSASDILWLVDNFPKNSPKPRLYAACGKQDGLYGENITLRDFMANKGFDYKFEDGDGRHDWNFWDKWIQPALDFMIPQK